MNQQIQYRRAVASTGRQAVRLSPNLLPPTAWRSRRSAAHVSVSYAAPHWWRRIRNARGNCHQSMTNAHRDSTQPELLVAELDLDEQEERGFAVQSVRRKLLGGICIHIARKNHGRFHAG